MQVLSKQISLPSEENDVQKQEVVIQTSAKNGDDMRDAKTKIKSAIVSLTPKNPTAEQSKAINDLTLISDKCTIVCS